jgi:hypothetical protein
MTSLSSSFYYCWTHKDILILKDLIALLFKIKLENQNKFCVMEIESWNREVETTKSSTRENEGNE